MAESKKGLGGITNRVLDILFPPNCIVCGKERFWCCQNCLDAIECVNRDPCSRCGSLKFEHDCKFVIHNLELVTRLDGLVAMTFYHNPQLRRLLHGLKYKYATCLIPSVGQILNRYKNQRLDPWPWAGESQLSIQAVIGSPKRIRARGFDQAELLRDLVKSEFLPWAETVSLLDRRQSIQAQADLKPGPLRNANVSGVFSFKDQGSAQVPKAVVLVDDVFTSGATMLDAARALKSAGVEKVYGLVLAIGA
ncbi:MAG: double zinc ribbon domain-containing protein [Patescibacteria group bacterium]